MNWMINDMKELNNQRIFEAFAHKDTYCCSCEKKIYKSAVIVVGYIGRKLISIRCADCYLKNKPGIIG